MTYADNMFPAPSEMERELLAQPAIKLSHEKAGEFEWSTDQVLDMIITPLTERDVSLYTLILHAAGERVFQEMVNRNKEYFITCSGEEILAVKIYITRQLAEFFSRGFCMGELYSRHGGVFNLNSSEIVEMVMEFRKGIRSALGEQQEENHAGHDNSDGGGS
ncbi:hypothetical protein SEA_JUMBO_80 [Gordonia phage Jumbo]|uniref:Uncharacterized protein n=1 Tax=Gordonia phage Jumbo TaxID=1887650 RepID=A0A1B3B0X2_9CAUD|nr:hypothetical protein BIZ69_gp080 [Gordonia phage Jumbo]AOE44588.1 hypothetical protein SEA_JUMBO_80 [Gordonia phage Jumbo]